MACFSLDVAGVGVVEVTIHGPPFVLIAAAPITWGGSSYGAGASWEFAAATEHALGFGL